MLTLKQRHQLRSIRFSIHDGDAEVGFVDWSLLPTARNAKVTVTEGTDRTPRFQLRGEEFRIEFEYTQRGWFNDIRFELLRGQEKLAAVEGVHQKRPFSRPSLEIRSPFEGQLQRKNTLLRTLYEVASGDRVLGRIQEPRAFSWNRELTLELDPSIPEPVQVFLFFVMYNAAYR